MQAVVVWKLVCRDEWNVNAMVTSDVVVELGGKPMTENSDTGGGGRWRTGKGTCHRSGREEDGRRLHDGDELNSNRGVSCREVPGIY